MSHRYKRGETYWLAYYQNNKLVRESLHTKDTSAAKYLQNKKDRELIENRHAAPSQNNLCLPALKEYLSYYEHRRTNLSSDKTKHEVEDFLTWGDIKTFEDITEKKFQKYLNYKISNKQLAQSTLNRYIASIKAWLNHCIKLRYIFFNPLSNVKTFKLIYNPKEFLSKEQIKTVLVAAQNPDLYVDKDPCLYPLIATGIYSGMRPQEVFTLEWQDIDFKHDQVMVRNKVGFTIKTKKFRVMPLFSRLKAILKPLRKENGACFDTTNKRRIFNRIREEAKLMNINWYTLRHTFISHALMDGIPIHTVSRWVGHSSITTTMGYAHLLKDHSKKQIEKLSF
ncbi:MAG: tyrosine-type recombinase/integrase [Candidatus Omnitrophota bacterium]